MSFHANSVQINKNKIYIEKIVAQCSLKMESIQNSGEEIQHEVSKTRYISQWELNSD
jgi:hypothetical protein